MQVCIATHTFVRSIINFNATVPFLAWFSSERLTALLEYLNVWFVILVV